MTEVISTNARRLLRTKEQMEKEHPNLSESYSRFLKDWKEYSKQRKADKSKSPRSNSPSEASFTRKMG